MLSDDMLRFVFVYDVRFADALPPILGAKYLRSSMAAILLFLDNSISFKNYSKTII